jgi:hypothetical protein
MPSIHSLSQELLRKVLHFAVYPDDYDFEDPPMKLEGKSNALLATVHSTWQPIIEELNFTLLIISQHDLPTVAKLVNPARQRYLRVLTLNVLLDEYDDEARLRPETPEEMSRNSRVFTDAVRDLFKLISTFQNFCKWNQLMVTVHVHSPSDMDQLPDDQAEALVQKHLPVSLLRRYEASMIAFLDVPQTLPSCPFITDLRIQQLPGGPGSDFRRVVNPATVELLVSRCPQLWSLAITMVDWPLNDAEERMRRRKALAGVINRLPSIANLRIAYWAPSPWVEKGDPQSIEKDVLPAHELTHDPLSTSLRNFYRRPEVERLLVTNTMLGWEFFWAPYEELWTEDPELTEEDEVESESENSDDCTLSDGDSEQGYNNWQPCGNLTQLCVSMPNITPHGNWLFEHDDGSDTDETVSKDSENNVNGDNTGEHVFCERPVHSTLNPYLRAMARCIRHAPQLEIFIWDIFTNGAWPVWRVSCTPYEGGRLTFKSWSTDDVDEDVMDYCKRMVGEVDMKTFP